MTSDQLDPRVSLLSESGDISDLSRSIAPSRSVVSSLSSRSLAASTEGMYVAYQRAESSNMDLDAPESTTPRGFSEVGLGITTPLGRDTLNSREQRTHESGAIPPPAYSLFQNGRQRVENMSSELKASMPVSGSSVNTVPSNGDSQTRLLGNASITPASFSWSPPEDNQLKSTCPTRRPIVRRSFSRLTITIILLATYSTILSGIYLAVAFAKPRFGKHIGSNGSLAPSTANLLSALFAKTIELSFVTVCVSFLGQVLSHRAITKDSRGITIADMSMRAWIMQPGSLITHWQTVRYAAWTVLGVIALTASFVAMMYTTAAEALVSPKLKIGPVEPRMLHGQVYTKFANPVYLSLKCETPITQDMDPVYRGTTCLQIEHVGQAFHNYQQYIAAWSDSIAAVNSTSTVLALRPKPHGTLYDNTTVTGSWIETNNMTELSIKYGRMVNNVTAAMPHTNVLAAARDPANDITQPDDLDGQGQYEIEASVPSPAVNVLCVGMSEDELAPLIYTKWPGTEGMFDAENWTSFPPSDIPVYPDWLNRTVVDEIFGFGEKYGQRPPIFPKLPKPYNTILNTTGLYNANSIYLLGASPANFTPPYVLCSLKAKQSDLCSTRYEVATSGGNLNTRCETPGNKMQYNYGVNNVPKGEWEADWKNIASEWASALSLGSGVTDGDASNARLLTQLIPPFNNKTNTSTLEPELPSISEALAVMAGSTLLLSTQNAPFVTFWNYSTSYLNASVYQSFNATLQAMGYASGGTENWQGIFYVILLFVFLTNIICLGFMLFEVRGKQMTDFTEPQNLFALAMNSPATSRLQGACGSGPEGGQFKERWHVRMNEDDEHYYIRTKLEENVVDRAQSMSYSSGTYLEPFETQGNLKPMSPAVKEFRRLSQKHSFLSRFY